METKGMRMYDCQVMEEISKKEASAVVQLPLKQQPTTADDQTRLGRQVMVPKRLIVVMRAMVQ